ncbi:di-trans,poly-cis-decaprenylcistransferase [Pelagibacterales bacterium SAG-MED34]|nr:di-trans,poly-cis-decaprenylcistransferase [Pelagibacterales bacterium SAG-MED34]
MILPKHVAIIMDGNGRWGIQKKKTRNYGHSKGIEVVENIIEEAVSKKIKHLTLFTFSTENWKRPKSEIKFLISILENYIQKELNNLIKKKIKLKIIGNLDKFPQSLKLKLRKAENLTRLNKRIQIIIALNYGSKEEIINTVKKLNKSSIRINEKNISENLYTKNIPDPEILIRTGNRNRLSNFLLWQLSYAEIYFVSKLWPDFTRKDFSKIITNFSKVKRNFGGIK